jgi:hypothetical protein
MQKWSRGKGTMLTGVELAGEAEAGGDAGYSEGLVVDGEVLVGVLDKLVDGEGGVVRLDAAVPAASRRWRGWRAGRRGRGGDRGPRGGPDPRVLLLQTEHRGRVILLPEGEGEGEG